MESASKYYFKLVTIKGVEKVLSTKIIVGKHGQTIGDMINDVHEDTDCCISAIFTSKTEHGDRTETPPSTPVEVLSGFENKFIFLQLKAAESEKSTANPKDTLIVRLGLNCSSSIETTYYSNVTQSFTSICFYCGDSDIHESEDIRRLKEEYSIVRPICFSCVQLGKSPAVRNALKMKRKRND